MKKVGKSGGGGRRRNKNEYIFIFKAICYIIYIFEAKERKQYQNNGTENLFVVIIYLIEAFKMRLLSMAESFESS